MSRSSAGAGGSELDVVIGDYPVAVAERAAHLGCPPPDGLTLLPINFLDALSTDEFVDDEFAPDVRAAWREAGVPESRLVDTGSRFRIRVGESIPQWAHMTLFVGSLLLTQNPAAVQVALGVLSSVLADLFKSRGMEGGVNLDVVVEQTKAKHSLKITYVGNLAGLDRLPDIINEVWNSGGRSRRQ